MLRLARPEKIEPYLSDASQLHGQADEVFLPENEQETALLLKEANSKKIPVTISGGKTGLVGAAVPLGGWALSTEKLSRILGIKKDPSGKNSWARVEPGIFLKNLNQALEKDSLFYAPDPTGPKALIGGTLATNASGPNSFKYGDTRRYVRRIRVILAGGEALELRRGQILANRQGTLEIPLVGAGFPRPRGAATAPLRIPVPHYQMPSVKHATGYFAAPGMDAIDLFIGSEGTLGVITEIEVALLPKPAEILAFIAFFPSEEKSWRFARSIRAAHETRVLEYFDSGSLEFLRPKFPSIPKEARAALFIEEEVGAGFPRPTGAATAPLRDKWFRLFKKGGALDEIWQGDTPEKEEEFRKFRSELPLSVRDFLARHRQMKIGTDTCVPPGHFEELMLFHRRQVEDSGLASVTFGHIGESHVHLNLLPRNQEEAEKGRALYPVLVEKAVALGGTFSAEHGVGKLKRPYLQKLYGPKGIEEMRAVKRIFDPHGILGRGNLFEIQ